MMERRKKVLPLVTVTNHIAGMFVFSDVKRIVTGSKSNYNIDSQGHLLVGAAIGVGSAEIERAILLAEAGADVICIDTAHGDSKDPAETLRVLKNESTLKNTDIIVGNVSEGPSARRLVDAGADGIKVGQGPGSICTTRIIAGIGCPQVTAVYNCAKAVKDEVPLCADGGIKYSGDITIIIGAGAHTVMIGKLLAGTDESPGEKVLINGVPHKSYRGMGSLGAMRDSAASRERYGDTSTSSSKDLLVPEGVEGVVPYKGSVLSEIHQLVEGLRRGMGYVGAATIEELREKAEFHRISNAGLQESHPHGLRVAHDAPNYRKEQ
jgi:IMP dehydrogenase